MKFFVCSDLHTEFLQPVEQWELFKKFPDADGIIIAGDLTSKKYLIDNLKYLCDKYQHVLFVNGNHEFYNSSFQEIEDLLNRTGLRSDMLGRNFHWLNDSTCTINGTNFIGGTLWFPDNPLNQLYERQLSDFSYIKDFRKDVYERNKKTIDVFNKQMNENSIVITHHLPSYQSVSDKYKGDQLNRFFVCDIENLILDRQPKYLISGHTHDSCNYFIGKTHVIANPLGYPHERNINFNWNLIIDL